MSPSEAPVSRRDAFLLIAAAVADGMPVAYVRVNDSSIDLTTDDAADAARWLAWFGGDPGTGSADLNRTDPANPFWVFRHGSLVWLHRYVYVVSYEKDEPVVTGAVEAANKIRAAAAGVNHVAA